MGVRVRVASEPRGLERPVQPRAASTPGRGRAASAEPGQVRVAVGGEPAEDALRQAGARAASSSSGAVAAAPSPVRAGGSVTWRT
eukprot:3837954-Pyramimonas_sp.AAC.1